MVIIGLINWFRYERNFDLQGLEEEWKDEGSDQRTMKGWLIGLYLLASFLIPAGYGYLKHNLNAI
jgi:hypothetical protein